MDNCSRDSPERWRQIKRILEDVVELDGKERARLLDERLADAPGLRFEVESLLVAHDNAAAAGNFFGVEDDLEKIGSYEILRPIGQGGMGVVYLAAQTAPIRRRVAIKLIQAGMGSRDIVARFDLERQALALMEHPNIAMVFDAGETESGRPYFIMEYVPGIPITEYCDRKRFTIRQRLDLFVQACEGVQHAHHKAVIHRDIKPSNVLVTEVDGRPLVKIIDFGVAKAVDQRLTERSVLSEVGMMIGTPEYMSPEQAGAGETDVDTRSDVYSLGALLYELLTGERLFDSEQLRKGSYEDIRRRIREEEPWRPSKRVGPESTAAARNRQAETPALSRMLNGDLDWITMRALEKDRARRYDSPVALAEDLARHFRSEPVVAGPPSVSYRAKRFARRHRASLAFAAAAVFALVVFAGAMAYQAQRIADERDRAQEANEGLEAVVAFQAGMLSGMDTEGMGLRLVEDLKVRVAAGLAARGLSESEAARVPLAKGLAATNATDVALRLIDEEILARATDELEEQFNERPTIDARIRDTIGASYQELGLYDQALTQLEEVFATREQHLGPDHPDTLAAIANLGSVYHAKAEYEEAESRIREALEKQKRVLGDDHPDTLGSVSALASVLSERGELEESERLHREVYEKRRIDLGESDPEALKSLNNLAYALVRQGKLGEAEPLLREVVDERRRSLGDMHFDTLLSITNLGDMLRQHGRPDEAEPLQREAFEGYRRVKGDTHFYTLVAANNLAALQEGRGELDEAESLYRWSLERRREKFGETNPQTLAVMNNLGLLLLKQGETAEAEVQIRKAYAGFKVSMGNDHEYTASAASILANVLETAGKLNEAETLYRESVAVLREALPAGSLKTLGVLNNLVRLLRRRGEFEQAVPYLREVLEGARVGLGEDHPSTAVLAHDLGTLLRDVGNREEAEKYMLEALESRRRLVAEDPTDRDRYEQVLSDLIELYDSVQKGNEADDLRAELAGE